MATEARTQTTVVPAPRGETIARPASWYINMIIRYTVLILVSILVLGPFILAVLGSFKTNAEVLAYPPTLFPSTWNFNNYVYVWNNVTDPRTGDSLLPRWFFNSLVLAVITLVGQLFFCSLAAFAFARLRFPGKDIIFSAMVATMMVPAMVVLIPKYQILNALHWLNTYLALLVPGIVGAFGIFLLTQFFRGIPRDLEEAAQIDGASIFTTYWRVILPMAKPALITLAVLQFQGSWNNFLEPLIFLSTLNMYTLPVGLQFLNGTHPSYNYILAGSMFNTIPVLIIFAFFSRYYVYTGAGAAVKG